jgi:hypothetical protein
LGQCDARAATHSAAVAGATGVTCMAQGVSWACVRVRVELRATWPSVSLSATATPAAAAAAAAPNAATTLSASACGATQHWSRPTDSCPAQASPTVGRPQRARASRHQSGHQGGRSESHSQIV